MKAKTNNFWGRGIGALLMLLAGIGLGRYFFAHPQESHADPHAGHTMEAEAVQEIWTCSMHPQIRMDHKGKCPLCGMDLIPLRVEAGATTDHHHHEEETIQMSAEAMALADVATTTLTPRPAVKQVRLYGTIEVDERRQHSQTSHVDGRIEELYINFTGETVSEGQPIAKIYSPDLLTAQQELIEASKMADLQPALLAAAREKLLLWKLADTQIEQILTSQKVSPYVEITANASGIVTGKNVKQGDHANEGHVLYTISDLSSLWGIFEAYESDLPFLQVGDKVSYRLTNIPDEAFEGEIDFINPLVDPRSRTAKVRVNIDNSASRIKPGMYATALVESAPADLQDTLIVPKSAVLWTGPRSLAYVRLAGGDVPTFALREISLGLSLGDSFVVTDGLAAGDRVVTQGAFMIDASAQLAGQKSMMNRHQDAHAMEMDHAHCESEAPAAADDCCTSETPKEKAKDHADCESETPAAADDCCDAEAPKEKATDHAHCESEAPAATDDCCSGEATKEKATDHADCESETTAAADDCCAGEASKEKATDHTDCESEHPVTAPH